MELSDVLTLVFGILGMVTGIVGLCISFFSYDHNKIEALNLYFIQAREPLLMDGKKIICDLQKDEKIDLSCADDILEKVSHVTNFYHHWGLMVKRNQLPFWIFYDKKSGITSSGIAVVRTYNRLKPTIQYFRRKNEQYAEYYEWLYNQIIKKCPKYKNYTG